MENLTYNEVLQHIIRGYHERGYTCLGVLRSGLPTTDVFRQSVFRVILRRQRLNAAGELPTLIITATLAQHQDIFWLLDRQGNIRVKEYVKEYDGKED